MFIGSANLIPDHIERDILIEAPIEVVWGTVTRPDQISQWWSDAAEFELRAGSKGTFTWNAGGTHTPTTVQVTVETIEPPRAFSFRWGHPEGVEACEGNSLLVEFVLTPEGEHTRLRVVETGLLSVDWPEEQKATYAGQHRKGWEVHLASLRDNLSKQSGVPWSNDT